MLARHHGDSICSNPWFMGLTTEWVGPCCRFSAVMTISDALWVTHCSYIHVLFISQIKETDRHEQPTTW